MIQRIATEAVSRWAKVHQNSPAPGLFRLTLHNLGGYIPILGWGGDVDQNPCMHTTPYTGSEIQREHNTGIRKCPGGLGKKL